MTFNTSVEHNSYIAKLSRKNNVANTQKPPRQEPPSSSRAICMEDIIPISKRVSRNNSKTATTNGPWATSWFSNEKSPIKVTSPTNLASFTDTHTQEERKMSNSSYTSDTARNVQNESEQWSPSSSVQSTSRTRESTNNSLSFVKITKANNKFEDLKSEAMNLWTEGVDLELDSNANSKKKSAWLSQSAFFENDIDIPQKPLKEATSSTVENTRPQQQQTYAEIADNKTPAWALHNDVQPNQHPVPLQQHRLSNHWSPNELMPMQSMMVAPPAFIPVAKPSPKDIELIQYLYHYLHKPNSPQRLQALKKKVDAVLQQDLQEISLRSFSYLLDALTVLLEYEHQHAKNNTIRKIRNVLPMFGSSLTHFIQTYIVLPPDLVSVLRFLLSIKHFSDGEVFNELPKDGILQLYEQMKPMDTHNDMIKLLRQLHMSSDSNDHFSSNDEPLPKVPNAEVVITEVIHKINALEEFEAKKNLPINIPVQEPWANMDITRYMLVHFMLLRDEAVGPLQKVVKGLFKGTPLSEIKEPECAIYEKTTPVSTTLMVSSSESGVVFRLGQPRPNDQLMEDMQEGSLVLLVSEDIRPSESRLNIKKKVAELSMMGKVVRASSSVSSTGELIRLVSIHVNKEEVSKIDWNGHYTMVSTKINAAAIMSILSWLYEQSIDIDKKRLSGVLTPRILGAKNVLTQEQLQSLDGDFYEHVVSTNDDIVPQYLQNEIDVGSIMVKNGNYRAQPKENVWPRLSHQWDSVSPSKRPPLYSLSPSQLSALKFALTHRVAIISGAPGTGKTHLAGKLAQVMSEALRSGQFHQPILVITKSQSTLDQILSSIVRNIPDMIRFGPEPYIESLVSKQATKLAAPSFSDTNFRQYQSLEHKLIKNQSRLLALFRMRTQVKNHAPAIFSTMIPPAYLTALTRSDPYATPLSAWNAWAEEDELTKKYKEDVWETLSHAQWVLETAYLKHNGRGLMPIIEPNAIRNRFGWVANNVSYPLPISDAINWPYEKSRRTGNELRVSLLSAWKNAAPAADQIWHLKKPQRTNLIEKLAQTLLSFIDSEIEDLLQEQINLSQSFDEILVGKLTYLCRFNRIIGMTSDFAAAHRDWVSTLWPRAVIVDEASDMLESTLVSSLLGPRTEHVILLGSTDHTNKPRLINPSLSARNLHVSLFERWKNTANDFALLEEQWRMHSEVADVIDKFNSIKLEKSSLLITAPMASCSENMVDRRYMNNEVLYGITQRAFYLHYTQPNDEDGDETYSKLLKTPLTKAEVDEARFVAFFAVYMSQQPYHHTSITVLTLTLLQKYLIRSILHSEVPKRTFFKSQVAKINLDVVEQYAGRYDNFVIISTATPGYSSSSYDNISCALTRARYGLFVIGKPGQDKAHDRWKDFADYMDERQLMGPAIQLTCHVHGDTIFARKWSDFDKMKNGGCERKCDTLMSDGHVCREDCHFLSHDEIVCQEPCIRLRPSNCNHSCGRKCYECAKDGCCPPCMVESQIELPCGHTYRDVCHKLLHLDEVKCREVVDVSLPCGHVAPVECCRSHQVSSIICKKKTEVELDCGHIAVQTCGMDVVCMEVCKERLECGHLCHELCGIQHSHKRSQCTASCPKQLICGHQCAKGCANPDDHTERCLEKCNYICSHGYKCSRECWRDCIRCVSECPYRCDHYKCTKKCYEICDRPPCDEPCKKMLGCYHRCSGLCGEPCPPCRICNPDLECKISLRALSEFDLDEKVYMLPECGCVYSVDSLDQYFENQAKNGEHTAIKLWDCPTCKKTIYTALRYNRYIKTEIALVNEIKLRLEQERQRLTHHEIEQIISAMNSETRSHAIHNIVGGRWFVCPNKHPYYVGDCGGATEISKCPECDALIGGVEHRVVESNRFYGEFDGSEKPAWPGQPGAVKE